MKIPDYVTNKKKKKTAEKSDESSKTECEKPAEVQQTSELNVIRIPDDDLELPSTSGLIRGFQFNDDTNYDMSILMDIDDEFSDFQLLSPDKDYDTQDDANDNEQFSIIDATGMKYSSVKFPVSS